MPQQKKLQPPQHQKQQPGREHKMEPRPRAEDEKHRGSAERSNAIIFLTRRMRSSENAPRSRTRTTGTPTSR